MSNNYRNNGFGADAAEQARRNFEQTQENSIDKLASFSSVKEENGKYSWMGFEVPTEVAGTLQYIASVLPNYVNNFLRDGVYENSEHFFNKFNKSVGIQTGPNAGRKFGLGAAAFVGGALIAAQPASEIIHSVHQRRKDRLKIKQAISAVIETNSGYKDNEVIKTAMERVNKTMVSGFKHAASELPTVILNGYYARESHKNLVQKVERNAKFHQASNGENGALGALEDGVKEYRDNQKAYEEIKRKHSDLDKHAHKDIYDAYLESEKERKLNDYEQRNSNKPENSDETNKLLAISVAGGANAFLKSLVAKGREADNKNPSAYELITDLQEKINNGDVSKGSDITAQIVEIFQQNEIDRGRPAVGPALMEKFNPLAERIAEVISNREIDAISLVNFVGDGKVVNKRHFMSVEQLDTLIDSQRKIFSLHEKTPLDEFLADFQNPKMVMQVIKENLKTMEGDSKAVFTSMFPDEVLIAAGVKKKEIPSLRTRGHDYMTDFIKSSTIELAKKTPEELKAKGLSEKQVEAINNLNELIVAGNEKAVKSTIASTDNNVISAVRTAGLNNPDKMYWTKVITKKPQITVTEKPVEGSIAETVKAKSGRENGAALNV